MVTMKMSIINEVERREEIKKKLKSRPSLPPMIHESGGAPSLRAHQSIKIEVSELRGIAEEHLPVLQRPQLRPLTIRPKMPTHEELKEVSREAELSTLRTIHIFKATSIELKPKIPRAQGVEGLKVEEPQVPVKELPRELKASLKPLRPAVIGEFKSEPLTTPMVKLPQVSVEAQRMTPRVIPRPINVEMSASEGVRIQAEILREPSKSLEEEVSLPPLFEELSSIAKPIGRPVCIVLSKRENDSFAKSVAIACREIYRIVKGGKPTPRYISKGLRDEIERELKAEGMIFIVDDSKCEFLPELSRIRSCRELIEKVDMEKVFDRLCEFFSQDFGFVIFHVNERWAVQFTNLLREKVGAFVDIVEVRAPHLSPQAKEVLARACWGFVKGGEGQTFDELFGNCEKEFSNKLEKVCGDIGLAYYVKRDEGASDEHEEMKMFVVECLARELGAKSEEEIVQMLKDGKIETETERELRNRGRVDVYVNVPSRQRYVEVETFYGTGNPIIKKLVKETLSKYEGIARQVDIVLLTGLQALLYARRLFELADFYRKERGLEVNFYVPNLEEKRLVPLKEMLHMLREVLGSSRQVRLTEDDVKKLWVEFSNALHERGMNPEEYRRLFNIMIDRSRPYEDNMRWMLEEVEALRGQ
jgi:hypothetical protein